MALNKGIFTYKEDSLTSIRVIQGHPLNFEHSSSIVNTCKHIETRLGINLFQLTFSVSLELNQFESYV